MSLKLVQRIRNYYSDVPNPLERAFKICNETVNALGGAESGWGVFRKGPANSGGTGYVYFGDKFSLDLIFNNKTKTGVDILRDAEHVAEARWQVQTIHILSDWERAWRAPIRALLAGIEWGTDPHEPPDPTIPGDTDPKAMRAAINDAVARITRLENAAAMPLDLETVLTEVVKRVEVGFGHTDVAGPSFLSHDHPTPPLPLRRKPR